MKRTRTVANKGEADRLIGEAALEEQKKKIAPPPDMTEREKEIWNGYIDSLPSDYFLAHEVVVFTQYIRILAKLDELTEELHSETITVIDSHTNSERLNPKLNAMKHLSAVQSVLARQLRLVTGTIEKIEQRRRQVRNENSDPVKKQNGSKRSHLFGSRKGLADADD